MAFLLYFSSQPNKLGLSCTPVTSPTLTLPTCNTMIPKRNLTLMQYLSISSAVINLLLFTDFGSRNVAFFLYWWPLLGGRCIFWEIGVKMTLVKLENLNQSPFQIALLYDDLHSSLKGVVEGDRENKINWKSQLLWMKGVDTHLLYWSCGALVQALVYYTEWDSTQKVHCTVQILVSSGGLSGLDNSISIEDYQQIS